MDNYYALYKTESHEIKIIQLGDYDLPGYDEDNFFKDKYGDIEKFDSKEEAQEFLNKIKAFILL